MVVVVVVMICIFVVLTSYDQIVFLSLSLSRFSAQLVVVSLSGPT